MGEIMKIVSWNCKCAFREKCPKVAKYDADIYVISEAEILKNMQMILSAQIIQKELTYNLEKEIR